jgi:K+-sensing histidine kinase KdpD
VKHIVSCEIIKDLLPNYIENILSNEGNELVKGHIDSCIHCRKEYEVISSTIDINTVDKVKVNYLKKINKKFLIMLILSLIVTVISTVLLTFYTEPNFEEGILTLIFLSFIIIAIIIKFIIPLIGLIFSIIYLKKTHKKFLIVPIIICSMWLFKSLYIYIRNLIYY